MLQFLENLKQKPESTKKYIAFSVAFFVSGIIFVVWLSVIYPDFRAKQDRKEYVSEIEKSPLTTLKESITTGVSGIKEEISKAKESLLATSSQQLIPQ